MGEVLRPGRTAVCAAEPAADHGARPEAGRAPDREPGRAATAPRRRGQLRLIIGGGGAAPPAGGPAAEADGTAARPPAEDTRPGAHERADAPPAETRADEPSRANERPAAAPVVEPQVGAAVLPGARVRARAVARPVRGTRAEPGIRLTRRGRIVVGLLAALVAGGALAALWALCAPSPGARGGTAPVPDRPATRTVVVGERDTLWDIAVRTDPRTDPRVTVRRIRKLNGLSGSIVQPGRKLRVPTE
ncbi:LysM peptidoglycan-binding domain-containing protein [Actinomadura atramentaria]|uniref:LysM peptidoglycan-binding domain-containing protein n=1 Tax=Actinomadura atramentaria TaxID=1990 RepID=UPI0003788C4B|nr:LysM peptidoglycan-binding domain-containing protein [Actinomadura atramentaria]